MATTQTTAASKKPTVRFLGLDLERKPNRTKPNKSSRYNNYRPQFWPESVAANQLLEAIRTGEIPRIGIALSSVLKLCRHDLNAVRSGDGRSLNFLFEAYVHLGEKARQQVVQLLVENGARLAREIPGHGCGLHFIANDEQLLRYALVNGVRLNATYDLNSGETALHRAIRYDVERARNLMEYGADPYLPNFIGTAVLQETSWDTDNRKFYLMMEFFNETSEVKAQAFEQKAFTSQESGRAEEANQLWNEAVLIRKQGDVPLRNFKSPYHTLCEDIWERGQELYVSDDLLFLKLQVFILEMTIGAFHERTQVTLLQLLLLRHKGLKLDQSQRIGILRNILEDAVSKRGIWDFSAKNTIDTIAVYCEICLIENHRAPKEEVCRISYKDLAPIVESVVGAIREDGMKPTLVFSLTICSVYRLVYCLCALASRESKLDAVRPLLRSFNKQELCKKLVCQFKVIEALRNVQEFRQAWAGIFSLRKFVRLMRETGGGDAGTEKMAVDRRSIARLAVPRSLEASATEYKFYSSKLLRNLWGKFKLVTNILEKY